MDSNKKLLTFEDISYLFYPVRAHKCHLCNRFFNAEEDCVKHAQEIHPDYCTSESQPSTSGASGAGGPSSLASIEPEKRRREYDEEDEDQEDDDRQKKKIKMDEMDELAARESEGRRDTNLRESHQASTSTSPSRDPPAEEQIDRFSDLENSDEYRSLDDIDEHNIPQETSINFILLCDDESYVHIDDFNEYIAYVERVADEALAINEQQLADPADQAEQDQPEE